MPLSLSNTSAIYNSLTSISTICQPIQSPPNAPSSSTQQSTASTSSTNNVKMGASRTMPSSKHATTKTTAHLLWCKSSKMTLPSEPFETWPRAHASSYCTLACAGPRQCTLPCGHMPCAMQCSSTIACQCWRMANQG